MTHTAAHVQGTRESLDEWHKRRGTEHPWNPNVRGQMAARWGQVLRPLQCLADHGQDPHAARILEVGAGPGEGLLAFLNATIRPRQLTALEVLPDRAAALRLYFPDVTVVEGDATQMPLPDGGFDLACEQFCFCHIPDMGVKERIATEMLRVVRPGGFILIHDWRMTVERVQIFGPSLEVIRRLFQAGTQTEVVGRWPSQLWPQLGRPLSRFAPPLYQLALHLPGAAGSVLTLLRKH